MGLVTVSWMPSADTGGSGLKEYEVEVSDDGGGTWSRLATVTTNSHAYTAAPGSQLYRVRARDRALNVSPYSQTSAAERMDASPRSFAVGCGCGASAGTAAWAGWGLAGLFLLAARQQSS